MKTFKFYIPRSGNITCPRIDITQFFEHLFKNLIQCPRMIHKILNIYCLQTAGQSWKQQLCSFESIGRKKGTEKEKETGNTEKHQIKYSVKDWAKPCERKDTGKTRKNKLF